MRKKLFTIGHSTHSMEHFTSLLKAHGVQAICDVRSVPYSKHNPQFNRDSLQEELKGIEVLYVFLGKELGARSDNPACYVDGKVQYNCLVDEPAFRHGIQRLYNGVEKFRVALMCAERDPLTCHRTILICRELRESDLEIEHILADGSIETNAAAEKRLMSMLRIHSDMLHDEQVCIEQAYDIQARNIAYTIPSLDRHSRRSAQTDEDIHDRVHKQEG